MIISNKAKCLQCGEVLESKHVHDFVMCTCGALAVDGGREYLKRSYQNKKLVLELSVVTENEQ